MLCYDLRNAGGKDVWRFGELHPLKSSFRVLVSVVAFRAYEARQAMYNDLIGAIIMALRRYCAVQDHASQQTPVARPKEDNEMRRAFPSSPDFRHHPLRVDEDLY